MRHTLETAGKAAGLIDMDLLKVADLSLVPEDAVAALQRRYPAAFMPNARTMSDAEYQAAKRNLDNNTRRTIHQKQDEECLRRAEIKYGTREIGK